MNHTMAKHTGNCMSRLSELQLKVEQEVQRRHNEVVLGVFQWMCNKHNEYGVCQCEYCQKLPEYVRAKRHLQWLKSVDYDGYWQEYAHIILHDEKLLAAKRAIKALKVQKDRLKLIHKNNERLKE